MTVIEAARSGTESPPILPMLPTVGPLPQGPGWAFEFAWEGARTLADIDRDWVRLVGAERGLAAGFPELNVLADLARGRRMILDGTIVALDTYGRPNPARLQRRLSTQRPTEVVLRRTPVCYYVFDLLRLDDDPVHELPYQKRRELLEGLDLAAGPVALPPSFTETDGATVLETASQYGLPGVVAKRARSRYQPGRRSRSWVLTTQRPTQDVIIGGWVPGQRGIASLLVGLPTERGLVFVGQVGTGFGEPDRRELAGKLATMECPTSPFVGAAPAPDGVRWVTPDLLGEVVFSRWTPDGRLGHPAWRGLRPEKHPAALRRPLLIDARAETPADDERAERAELDEAVRRARAEVDALRAQISPHFLYNVLNTITSYVRFDTGIARELLVEFADFTRYTFRSDVQTSTLGAELGNVRRYLALEQARFGDRLRYDIQVPEGALTASVPYLSVQLAVEHAVQHGIEAKSDGGTVRIIATEEAGDCIVTVSDNGGGNGAAGGHGNPWRLLRTLDDRLRAANGDRGALQIDAAKGGGTSLTFRVPRPR